MKIIHGHDYYDGAGYGVDETVIFVRKMRAYPPGTHPFTLPAPLAGRGQKTGAPLTFGRAVLAGQVHPFVRVETEGERPWAPNIRFHYDAAAALEDFETLQAAEDWRFFRRKPRHDIQAFFDTPMREEWHRFLLDERIVTGLVERGTLRSENDRTLFADISTLKEVELYRKIDPATAHMTIQSFISGVLPHGPETVELDDRHRLEKAGFDGVTSFRTAPGSKKPRRRKS